MLNPEMTPAIEETLYIDAKNIYCTYLDPESVDFLNLPIYISQGMKQSNKIVFVLSRKFAILCEINYYFCPFKKSFRSWTRKNTRA
jgi:hypothetical protein